MPECEDSTRSIAENQVNSERSIAVRAMRWRRPTSKSEMEQSTERIPAAGCLQVSAGPVWGTESAENGLRWHR